MATRWLNHTSALLAALALTGCATRGIDPGPSVGDVMKGQTAPDPDVLPIIKSEPHLLSVGARASESGQHAAGH